MQNSTAKLLIAAVGTALLAGCSSDGGILGTSLTTQSIGTNASATTVAAAPKIDPACYTLSQRIDTLRKDGLTERLEKASAGKSQTVQIKRASLAQAAELDKANAEFQAKCSAFGPRPIQSTAQAVPAAPVANSSQVVSATAPPVVQQNR
jgi:hypothetical protein